MRKRGPKSDCDAIRHWGMMNGMTKRKIAITLSEQRVAEAKQAVAAGRARSVSAYIEQALASHESGRGLERYLAALIDEHGAPSAEDYAWADAHLDSEPLLPDRPAAG
jgi:Arc/MetJ-type ribon-helix-helix transcriptional regulator